MRLIAVLLLLVVGPVPALAAGYNPFGGATPAPVPVPQPAPTPAPVPVPVPVPMPGQGSAVKAGTRVVVTAAKLNVRATPNGKILGTQARGKGGAIVECPPKPVLWCKVNYDTGADGYSARAYLKAAPALTVTPGTTR